MRPTAYSPGLVVRAGVFVFFSLQGSGWGGLEGVGWAGGVGLGWRGCGGLEGVEGICDLGLWF